jgi:hypothetical protein
MFYRTEINGSALASQNSTWLLHFGAVDWACNVFVNGLWVGSHEGGYDSFSFDITSALLGSTDVLDEVLVQVYDPSNTGEQPFGKQRTSAMQHPAGDTYSPVSGLWQSVWLEPVPTAGYIQEIRVHADMQQLHVNAIVASGDSSSLAPYDSPAPAPAGMIVEVEVQDATDPTAPTTVVTARSPANSGPLVIPIPVARRKLWSPEHPFLYNVTVRLLRGGGGGGGTDEAVVDEVGSYFGMREVRMCGVQNAGVEAEAAAEVAADVAADVAAGTAPTPPPHTPPQYWKPCINGEYRFFAGVLDQSYWPDGLYTAPGDAALASDLETLNKTFGLNFVRLHQKVNPERWYYHADR